MRFLSDILAKAGLIVDGAVRFNNVPNATVDTDKFLVIDSEVVKYRTGAQVLSDIGAQAVLTNPVTGTGAATQVAYWTGTTTQSGSNNFTWNNITNSLVVNGAVTIQNTITATSLAGTGTRMVVALTDGVLSTQAIGVKSTEIFTATAGQSTFLCSYTAGSIDVYVNGVKLIPDEFTASNGTTIVLAEPLKANDILEVVKFSENIYLQAYRVELSGTTSTLSNGATENIEIPGFRAYVLMKIETSAAAWVRLYTDAASRTADQARAINIAPSTGSGLIAEVVTTESTSQIITPFVFGGNLEASPNRNIYARVTNMSGNSAAINVTLTVSTLEY